LLRDSIVHRDRAARRSRRPRDLLPYALIAPIGLLLLAITVYPTIEAVHLALTDSSLQDASVERNRRAGETL